ncbi:MAG: glycosyltransferase family 4 protein [Promethearchaeota archaeon]
MRNRKTILFICGAKESYVRNSLNLKALKGNFDIIKITSNAKYYFIRLPSVIFRFLFYFKKYNLIFVGFLGQPLMPFIKLFSKKPIIFDAFISLYDTLCFDRKKFKPDSLVGKLAYWFDKKSCQRANRIITDTNAHADYFSNTFNIDRDKFQTIYLGAEEDIFYPQNAKKKEKYENKFIIFYYGTGLPLQGIDVILKAAKLLENERDIIFQLVGPIRKKYKNLIKDLNPQNIEFIDWIPYNELPEKITNADICLGGHFSNIDKAKRVISGKTYQFIAMQKPVIIGDNPATRELFGNRENALMCKMGNEKSLTKAIIELKVDQSLREHIAGQGYQLYLKSCAPKNIGNILEAILINSLKPI